METKDISAIMEGKSNSKEHARKTRDVDFIAKQEMVDEDTTKSCLRMSEELNTSVLTISTPNREV